MCEYHRKDHEAEIADYDGDEAAFMHDNTIVCECGCGTRYMAEGTDWDSEARDEGEWVHADHADEYRSERYDPVREHGTYWASGGSVVG